MAPSRTVAVDAAAAARNDAATLRAALTASSALKYDCSVEHPIDATLAAPLMSCEPTLAAPLLSCEPTLAAPLLSCELRLLSRDAAELGTVLMLLRLAGTFKSTGAVSSVRLSFF